MLQIIKTKKVKARKDYTCHICGGIVRKGDYYLSVVVKEDGKMVRRCTHEGCLLRNAKPIEEQPKARTEEEFAAQIHSDIMYRLQAFDYQKNLKMSLGPLMMKCIAWEYAMKARNLCAELRISDTKKTARVLREQFEKFDRDIARDLNGGGYSVLHKEAQKFEEQCAADFTILYYSAMSLLQKDYSQLGYLEMRANAISSMVMIKAFWKVNDWSDDEMIKRFGGNRRFVDPTMDILYEAMDALACPHKLQFDTNLNNAVGVMFNRLMAVEFETRKKQP